MDAITIQAVRDSARLTIETDGPLVRVTAGFAYDIGDAVITPAQARTAAKALEAAAAAAEEAS
jgi:hypothetical protein